MAAPQEKIESNPAVGVGYYALAIAGKFPASVEPEVASTLGADLLMMSEIKSIVEMPVEVLKCKVEDLLARAAMPEAIAAG